MSIYKENILIIEDNVQIRKFMAYALQQEGFSCKVAANAKSGFSILTSQAINLVLLDLALPDLDGIKVIQKIREWSDIPIIVVSARDQDKDKVSALDQGADDYLTKPFSTIELLARIRVAIRHQKQQKDTQKTPELSVGDLSINFDKHLVFLRNKPIHVTPLEYQLLSLFFKNPGKVLTSQYIINEIYGAGYGTNTQALRALLSGLRRKIEDVPAKPRYIQTEIGVGYRLNDE